MDIGRMFETHGLLGLVTGGILTMCFFGFKWILMQFKTELDGNRKERTEYLNILNTMGQDIKDHNEQAKENHIAGRSEHKEMIISLGRINGYKI